MLSNWLKKCYVITLKCYVITLNNGKEIKLSILKKEELSTIRMQKQTMLSVNTTSFISNVDPSYLSLSQGFEVVLSRSSAADTCYTKTIPQKYREEGF